MDKYDLRACNSRDEHALFTFVRRDCVRFTVTCNRLASQFVTGGDVMENCFTILPYVATRCKKMYADWGCV